MNLVKDDLGARPWVIVTGAVLCVVGIITLVSWSSIRADAREKRQTIECIEKTNDPEWCLEVIG